MKPNIEIIKEEIEGLELYWQENSVSSWLEFNDLFIEFNYTLGDSEVLLVVEYKEERLSDIEDALAEWLINHLNSCAESMYDKEIEWQKQRDHEEYLYYNS